MRAILWGFGSFLLLCGGGSICTEDRGTHQMASISNLFQTMALGKLNDSFTASVVSTHNYLSCTIAGLNYLYSQNILLFEYHFHLHTFVMYTYIIYIICSHMHRIANLTLNGCRIIVH